MVTTKVTPKFVFHPEKGIPKMAHPVPLIGVTPGINVSYSENSNHDFLSIPKACYLKGVDLIAQNIVPNRSL